MDLLLLLPALLGHAFFWIALLNRVHGVSMPRWATGMLSLTCLGGLVFVPLAIGWWAVRVDLLAMRFQVVDRRIELYLALCWTAAGVTLAWWLWRLAIHRPPSILRSHRTQTLHPLGQGGGTPGDPASEEHSHHFLVRLPRNEILRLDVSQRVIEVPRLAPALDALSIVHVSDFHFTGRVGKAYFEQVARRCNEFEPDLIAVTGDLVDHSDYIDWIPDTLGRLRARYGVFFVLGNHDLRVDTDRLREVLGAAGLIDLGGRWKQVEIRGESVILAGNELPWIVPAADMSNCPTRTPGGGPLRIVLSHSPDQLDWAQAQDADLLLAGHTHGGQIRLPLIGPILSPSRTGVKYASGLFYAPPTIMHVTRGVSGELPVRLNCPPEIAHLVLHAVR